MNIKKDHQRLHELARKWKDGTITAQEEVEFNQWYDAFDDTGLNEISAESVQQVKDRLYNSIKEKEHIEVVKPVKTLRLWYPITAAAIVLLFLSVGIYLFTGNQNNIVTSGSIAKEDMKPGGNKALLTLADGTSIVINDAANGRLAEQNGVVITKTKDGQLTYEFKSAKHTGEAGITQFNTISTPKGGQYRISLPDGTLVWLNAETSIRFPVSFSKLKERKVELIGEAYFEVYKDKLKPFKVSSDKQEVEVLGTHFNVNTYKNETNYKTTLLEGSVRLHTAVSDVKLKAGEQAVLSGAAVDILKVNTDEVVAWKNGFFIFNDESLKSIMRQLDRWYNVQVDYSTVPDTRYNGVISRDVNLSKVLSSLEVTGNLKFKIEGKIIKIYK